MSRHAAPDDEAPSTPPTSDTGPLFLGHGGWPPSSPNEPSAPAQESFATRDTKDVDPESNGAYEQPTTPVPVHYEQRSPTAQRWSDTQVPQAEDSQVEDSQVEVPQVEDSQVEDSQVEVPQLEDPQLEDPQAEDPQAEHPAEPADDLALLPVEPTTEAGHRRRGRGAVPARRGRRPLGILVSLGVIAALVTGIFFGGRVIVDLISTDPAADYSGQGSGTVEIEVAAGASTAQIAEALVESDVVASAEAFLNAANSNPDILTIQPGVYQMRAQMSAEAAVTLILDPAARLFDRVTIPEGYTVARTVESLAEQTGIPLADFEAAVAAPGQLGLPAWSNGQLEGFLYPSTYDVRPDTSAVEMLTEMVGQFNEVAVETGLETNAADVGLTPYELLTVASMVQSEVTVEAERPLVARVIYNRLDQTIPLGIDATLAYERGVSGNELTTEELQTDSPYNTRIRLGLPPTPISNPGQPSIQGALQPAVGDWIYYVLQNSEGDHLFTASYEEFLQAKAQCEAAGLGCG